MKDFDKKDTPLCEHEEVHDEKVRRKREEMPDEETIYDLSDFFKIFGDSTRMKILFVLFESEACTCDLAEVLKMTPSAISHQLKTLQRAKLVKSRRDGRAVYYSLTDDHVRMIIEQGMEHIEE